MLRRRRVSPDLLMANQAATLAYRLFVVIGPWSYAVFTPIGPSPTGSRPASTASSTSF